MVGWLQRQRCIRDSALEGLEGPPATHAATTSARQEGTLEGQGNQAMEDLVHPRRGNVRQKWTTQAATKGTPATLVATTSTHQEGTHELRGNQQATENRVHPSKGKGRKERFTPAATTPTQTEGTHELQGKQQALESLVGTPATLAATTSTHQEGTHELQGNQAMEDLVHPSRGNGRQKWTTQAATTGTPATLVATTSTHQEGTHELRGNQQATDRPLNPSPSPRD